MSISFRLHQKHVSVLLTVCTFGYATTRDLATLGWPDLTPKSARKAAQLACKALEADKYILAKDPEHVPTDDAVYVLTAKGARFLCNEFTSLAFKPSTEVECNRVVLRRPVIELAGAFARERGLGVIGARGLAHGVFGLAGFERLDSLLVDGDDLDDVRPAFGIMLVRQFDDAAVARVKSALLMTVPVLFAASEAHQRTLAGMAKQRALYAPAHQAVVEANTPGDVAMC